MFLEKIDSISILEIFLRDFITIFMIALIIVAHNPAISAYYVHMYIWIYNFIDSRTQRDALASLTTNFHLLWTWKSFEAISTYSKFNSDFIDCSETFFMDYFDSGWKRSETMKISMEGYRYCWWSKLYERTVNFYLIKQLVQAKNIELRS